VQEEFEDTKEVIRNGRTDDTITQKKTGLKDRQHNNPPKNRIKGQTMNYRTLQRKQKIE
jgi:hypothetical protein